MRIKDLNLYSETIKLLGGKQERPLWDISIGYLHKLRQIPYLQVGKDNIVDVSILPNLIYIQHNLKRKHDLRA